MRYSEAQMSSELLDQPVFTGTPKKLFICSTPRSGSYMLCRYLIAAGIGIPHEYFNPIIMREMMPRLGLGNAANGMKWRPRGRRDRLPFVNADRRAEEALLARYVEVLVPRRCLGGVFAAKVHFDQYMKVLDNPTGRKLLDQGVYVHLFREELLKQAVSIHFSNLTGRWSTDETLSTVPATNPNFFDNAALDHEVQRLAGDDSGWRVFLARNGLSPISISYEQLCRDPNGFVAVIARRLGIDPATLPRDYDDGREPQVEADAALPGKGEVARRYVEAVRQISAAPAAAQGGRERHAASASERRG